MADPQPVKISSLLSQLPSVDELLQTQIATNIIAHSGRRKAVMIARETCEILREEILRNTAANGRESLIGKAESMMKAAGVRERRIGVRRVINATGVFIHTNLGRAPLSDGAKRAIIDQASGYCTLEYNIETSRRGKRGVGAELLICEITGAENAVIVNNCAAAAFLILAVFAAGKEVVISRGELIEIGGDFRVPDVLAQSGAILKEVGTTNRTKLSDYEKAIGENTGMILRVHPSNYKIIGFTESPEPGELVELAHRNNLILYEDAGSGALVDLSEYGLSDEPVIGESIAAGVDIVSFSGDKLLGSAQSGIIVGRHDLIEKIRKHPLYRALRVDKLAYAALEATLGCFARETHFKEIPVLQMLSMTADEIAERTGKFAETLTARSNGSLRVETLVGASVVGGGSAPGVQPETCNLALTHSDMSVVELEKALRDSDPPVIARIMQDRVLIDLRTVSIIEERELLEILSRL